jgi:beta-glucanase (GH16 family)
LDSLPDVSNSILATTDYAPTNPFLTPSLPSGFTHTLFSTTFSSSSLSDSWVVDVGTSYETNGTTGPSDWGTGEHQEYTSSSSNLGITTDSTLLMTPLYDSDTQTWTSARIETEESVDFACPEGSKLRVEASLKLGDASTDKQLGIWPAFWSLGSGYRSDPWSWPAVGEIDILESVNGLDTIWQTVHCGEADGGPCHETTGLFSSTDFSRGEWHIVAVEIDRTNGDGWEGEAIVWYVDGVETKRLKGSDVGDEDAWGRLAHDKRFLLLNVAVGGGMPDGVSGQTTPDAGTTGGAGSGMEVGYVGVYVS